ncbi:uncharacterized protein LACBIDRAFT_308793 [Laccaria bicolor S238N-H82]|uniref:Predicted protein n=1 Tax=Laccaria bicolor (strain S238N-H82 / ATCC MYA-4686) TaxID=486041 RepID=B0CX78_LACBS|nr:uncharacterized protein LACBIDRAFT_308793 [Laccaria bicolor S238N-H82]EDR13625.1 predicted protein [Laccaria bicolor S238N-H82]|eukprot:XP_001876123.1 predicted protein [Laccaria bicolor S238N-H82]
MLFRWLSLLPTCASVRGRHLSLFWAFVPAHCPFVHFCIAPRSGSRSRRTPITIIKPKLGSPDNVSTWYPPSATLLSFNEPEAPL